MIIFPKATKLSPSAFFVGKYDVQFVNEGGLLFSVWSLQVRIHMLFKIYLAESILLACH
jgi:hypothetical protein